MLKTYIEENVNDVLFYRHGFRYMIYFAFFLLIVNFCLLLVLFIGFINIPEQPNFATTSDGRLIEIKPE